MSVRLRETQKDVGPYKLTMWHSGNHEFFIEVNEADRCLGTACVVIEVKADGGVYTNADTTEEEDVGGYKRGSFIGWRGWVLTPRLEQACGHRVAHYSSCKVGWTWYAYIEEFLKE